MINLKLHLLQITGFAILMLVSAVGNADSVWARCDNCTTWQTVNAASAAVPSASLGQPVNERVIVMDFKGGIHKVMQVTGYFDFEMGMYISEVFPTNSSVAERNKIAVAEEYYAYFNSFIIEEGEIYGPEPDSWLDIDIPSAFDYWTNPGRTTTIINSLMDAAFSTWRPDLYENGMKRLIYENGTYIRLRANDGTFITVKAREMLGPMLSGNDIEFRVTELQTLDGTVIPLVQSDLTDDWAFIVVSNGSNLNSIVSGLRAMGVTVTFPTSSSARPAVRNESTIECKKNSSGMMECVVKPVPKDPK